MRILILGQPRSGTTTLIHAFGKSLGYREVHEPFKEGYYKINTDNTVVKTLINQPTPNLKDFGKVILLGRKDDKLAGESMQYAEYTGKFNDSYTLPERISYRSKQRRAWELRQRIELVSSITGIPITWYEDLYSGNIEKINNIVSNIWELESLNFNYPILYNELNPCKKLRQS